MFKTIDELRSEDGAWPTLSEEIRTAANEVRILAADAERAEDTFFGLQMSDKTTLGAVALNCGGLLIDRGWLRILGSGHAEIAGDLLSWNGLGSHPADLKCKPEGYVIVAYDVAGGFFALNNGAFDDRSPNVYYFAPDTLEWEDTEKGYSDFVAWALNGDLQQYYETFRWTDWERDVRALGGEQAMLIYPFLWSEEGRDVNRNDRNPTPATELWDAQQEMRRQIFES